MFEQRMSVSGVCTVMAVFLSLVLLTVEVVGSDSSDTETVHDKYDFVGNVRPTVSLSIFWPRHRAKVHSPVNFIIHLDVHESGINQDEVVDGVEDAGAVGSSLPKGADLVLFADAWESRIGQGFLSAPARIVVDRGGVFSKALPLGWQTLSVAVRDNSTGVYISHVERVWFEVVPDDVPVVDPLKSQDAEESDGESDGTDASGVGGGGPVLTRERSALDAVNELCGPSKHVEVEPRQLKQLQGQILSSDGLSRAITTLKDLFPSVDYGFGFDYGCGEVGDTDTRIRQAVGGATRQVWEYTREEKEQEETVTHQFKSMRSNNGNNNDDWKVSDERKFKGSSKVGTVGIDTFLVQHAKLWNEGQLLCIAEPKKAIWESVQSAKQTIKLGQFPIVILKFVGGVNAPDLVRATAPLLDAQMVIVAPFGDGDGASVVEIGGQGTLEYAYSTCAIDSATNDPSLTKGYTELVIVAVKRDWPFARQFLDKMGAGALVETALRPKTFPHSFEVADASDFLDLAYKHLDIHRLRVAVEGGSRDGAVAAQISRNLTSLTHVFAFEGNADTIHLCLHNAAKTKTVTVVNMAVSDKDGVISFFKSDPLKANSRVWPDGNPGLSSLFPGTSHFLFHLDPEVQTEVRVPTTRLDTFLAPRVPRGVDILWLDIQGAELPSLRSLGHMLATLQLIWTEITAIPIYVGMSFQPEIERLMENVGFRIVFRPKDLMFEMGDFGFVNRLFDKTRPYELTHVLAFNGTVERAVTQAWPHIIALEPSVLDTVAVSMLPFSPRDIHDIVTSAVQNVNIAIDWSNLGNAKHTHANADPLASLSTWIYEQLLVLYVFDLRVPTDVQALLIANVDYPRIAPKHIDVQRRAIVGERIATPTTCVHATLSPGVPHIFGGGSHRDDWTEPAPRASGSFAMQRGFAWALLHEFSTDRPLWRAMAHAVAEQVNRQGSIDECAAERIYLSYVSARFGPHVTLTSD